MGNKQLSTSSTFGFIILYLAVCIFSVYAGSWDYANSTLFLNVSLAQWTLILPVLSIVIWSVPSYFESKGSITKMLATADELYFIGYLGTVVSLVALVFIAAVLHTDLEINITTIMRSISVALTTTVAGLVFMFLFRANCRKLSPPDPFEEIKADIKCDIESETASIKDSIARLTSEVNKAVQPVEELGNTIEALSSRIGRVPNPIDGVNTKIAEVNDKLDNTAKRFEKIADSLRVVERFDLDEATIVKIHKGYDSLGEVVTSLSAMGTELSNLPGQLGALNGNIEICSSSLENFNAAVMQIRGVLADFAKLQELAITEEKEHRDMRIKQFEGLSSNIERLTTVVNSLYMQMKLSKLDGTAKSR